MAAGRVAAMETAEVATTGAGDTTAAAATGSGAGVREDDEAEEEDKDDDDERSRSKRWTAARMVSSDAGAFKRLVEKR